MKKSFFRRYGLTVIILCVLLSFLLNFIALSGAQQGGNSISKRTMFLSNQDPTNYYWQTYPFALLIALGVALVIIVIGSLASIKSNNKT